MIKGILRIFSPVIFVSSNHRKTYRLAKKISSCCFEKTRSCPIKIQFWKMNLNGSNASCLVERVSDLRGWIPINSNFNWKGFRNRYNNKKKSFSRSTITAKSQKKRRHRHEVVCLFLLTCAERKSSSNRKMCREVPKRSVNRWPRWWSIKRQRYM